MNGLPVSGSRSRFCQGPGGEGTAEVPCPNPELTLCCGNDGSIDVRTRAFPRRLRTPGRFPPAGLRQPTGVVCGFCSTGCGLTVHLRDGEAVNPHAGSELPGELRHGSPQGMGGPGTPGGFWTAPPHRSEKPRPRHTLEPVSWTRRSRSLRPAFRTSSRATVPARWRSPEHRTNLHRRKWPSSAPSLFKSGMGGLHCDSNTRQCMATAHVACQGFGFDAPAVFLRGLGAPDVLVFIGSNPCIAHPILWQRVLRESTIPRSSWWTCVGRRPPSPRRSISRWPQIRPHAALRSRPGMFHRGAVDRAFIDARTRGFEEFAASWKPSS